MYPAPFTLMPQGSVARSFRLSLLTACALAAPLQALAASRTYEIDTTARAGIQTFGNVHGPDPLFATGSAGTAFTTRADCCTGTSADGMAWAEAGVSGIANYGLLKGSAYATVSNLAPDHYPGLIYQSYAYGRLTLNWGDTLTVLGGKVGDTVQIQMTVVLEDTLAHGGSFNSYLTPIASAGLWAVSGTDPENASRPQRVSRSVDGAVGDLLTLRTRTMTFDEKIGEAFDVGGSLYLYAGSLVDTYHPGVTEWSTADASHTMHGYFDIVGGSGLTLSSASGHDYGEFAVPVPEPGGWALMLAGLLSVGVVKRRAATRRSQR